MSPHHKIIAVSAWFLALVFRGNLMYFIPGSTGVELLSSEEKDMDIGNKFSNDLNIFLPWFSSKHEDK